MRSALAEHDEVLREAVSSHGGYLFKHTGDGVCAAFASPTSAVDAAIDAQRLLELPVRMGIATGEAELRDSDYFGTALNRAARLMMAGHGGQILVADSTARLASGVDFVDLVYTACATCRSRSAYSRSAQRGCVRSFHRCARLAGASATFGLRCRRSSVVRPTF
jgi:class 3 adenylate cyclase